MLLRGLLQYFLQFSFYNVSPIDLSEPTKDEFLEELVTNMTVPELVLQLHIMFADDVVGPNSSNELYGIVPSYI